ncbi:MAG: response regulator transcription factor, partial [Candidatus Atribacteria bacterium]|nr:response regulator transcription factor [Candidatus Atribacteria bacterium]
MSDPIRILVADDHLIIRQGLRLILETEAGFELVGEAADGAEAVRLCAELHPAVVLMDLRMPGMDGLTAIEHLRKAQPEIAVVILTTFNEDDLMMRGLRAGAKGYLLKDTDRETLFNSIRAAARGETLLKPEIMARLLSKAGAINTPVNARTDLTERELEVLMRVAQGERS